jgi:HEAT repeat protein
VTVGETDASRRLAAHGLASPDLAALATDALASGAGLRVAQEAERNGPRAERFLARVLVHQVHALAPGSARAIVTVELAPLGEGAPLRETATGIAPYGPGPRGLDAAVRGAIADALAQASRSFAAHFAAAGKDDRALVADLGSADPLARDHAVRVLAERRNPAAVEPLLAKLEDPDPDVADRALGALAEIGDARAVPAIIDAAHRRGSRSLGSWVRIVGDLGGPEARAWLETVAAGHPDPGVRAAADETLGVLAAREAARREAAAAR